MRCISNNWLFSLDQSHEMSNYGAACSYFMNVWSLETSASPLTAIEVISVLPECLRSFLTRYKQDKTLGSTHPSSLGDSSQRPAILLPDSEIFSAFPISPSVWW